MRDVIWTIIIVWLVWKIYDTVKSVSKTNSKDTNKYYGNEGEIKINKKDRINKPLFNPNDGEYVDYEEIK